MTEKKAASVPERPRTGHQERPPFLARQTKKGKYIIHTITGNVSGNRADKRTIEATIGIEGGDARMYAWRRKGNVRAVLTMANIIDGKVHRLVDRNGRLIRELALAR